MWLLGGEKTFLTEVTALGHLPPKKANYLKDLLGNAGTLQTCKGDLTGEENLVAIDEIGSYDFHHLPVGCTKGINVWSI